MLVDSLNAVRWAGKRQRGFYEVWYMTLVDPTTGDSFWFRYTLTSPSSDAVPITAGVWGFSSSGKDPKAGLAVHDVYPIAKLANKSTEEKGFRVEVGTSFLERARAKGKVGSGDRSLEWDLTWEPKGAAVEHVSPALEAIGLARSSVNAAHAGVLMSGTVKVGGKSVKVDKWAGEQAHTWGKRHADQWAWAHCNAFAEDPGIVFEGVSARTSCLGMCLPTATPLYLRLPGSPDPEEHAWTSATTIFSNRSTFAFGRWDFEAESSDISMKGTATVAPERLIAVEYADPSGERLFSHHATGGDLVLELYRRVGARWSFDRKLTSKGTTAIEFTQRERDPRAGRALYLADARLVEDPKPAGVA